MQLMKLLHKTFQKKLPSVHKIRLNNLIGATETLIKTNKLTLTGLGRNLSNKNKTRSNIKKIDRLLGNSHLQGEYLSYYKIMNSNLINEDSCPWIHVDWSCICSVTSLYLLRASLSMSGRSIVIYEEVHPQKNENHAPAHKAFLSCLKAILPASVKPVIITDAGFRGPWFSEVLRIGWDFVGRIRNKNLVQLDHSPDWQLSQSFYQQANGKPRYLGHGRLTKKQKVHAHFVLFKGKKKNRKSDNSRIRRYIDAHKEPWLLVTSISPSEGFAREIVKIYHQRMRIEENFRDTKCSRYGFGLNESRTRSLERMRILLLIAAIATFACWLAAIIVRKTGEAADYQAHSSKFKSVLSSVYLGREAIKKGINLLQRDFANSLAILFNMTNDVKQELHSC